MQGKDPQLRASATAANEAAGNQAAGNQATAPDSSGRLAGLVAETLDAPAPVDQLAKRAFHGRSTFFRLFQSALEETPAGMRRRLRLERAAWQLSRTLAPITEIAFDANYGSLEAFTRAFRKAFRVSPSLYRRMGATSITLPTSNGIHFQEPTLIKKSASPGGPNDMDLFDIFNGAEAWHTRRLLETAAQLSDEQLDRPLSHPAHIFPWPAPDQSLREVLERMVYTTEVWTAALSGSGMPEEIGRQTPAVLLKRLESANQQFHAILSDVRNRGAWDDRFVDALCDPPETFTFGGMFAHVITFNAYRRIVAMEALRGLGAHVEGFGCPTEFEQSLGPKPVRGDEWRP